MIRPVLAIVAVVAFLGARHEGASWAEIGFAVAVVVVANGVRGYLRRRRVARRLHVRLHHAYRSVRCRWCLKESRSYPR